MQFFVVNTSQVQVAGSNESTNKQGSLFRERDPTRTNTVRGREEVRSLIVTKVNYCQLQINNKDNF